jgi:hypothetical protein
MAKGGVRGRWGRSAEKERFWRSQIEGHAASGLSAREWCRRERLSEPSFYAWRRELALRDREQLAPASANHEHRPASQRPASQRPASQRHAASPPAGRAQGNGHAFVPVRLAATGENRVELEFPSGLVVRVPAENTAALAAILEFAEPRSC